MFKVYSSCLLVTTLAFSSAHAPTSQLWRELATASTDGEPAPVTAYFDTHASLYATDSFAATREYAEDNDLKRFGLDEFYLPKLEIDEPELFNWSEVERSYLANNTLPISSGYLDSLVSASFYSSGANVRGNSGFVGGGFGGAPGGSRTEASTSLSSKSASSESSDESLVVASSDSSTNEPSEVKGEEGSEQSDGGAPTQQDQFADNHPPIDVSPIDQSVPPIFTIPADDTIIGQQEPVQVPAPGPLGLFVLGLAALRFVGRKKNGSG